MSNTFSSEDNKTPLALAALMFFSPFVQYGLSHQTPSSSPDDHQFISWYITLGYLTLVLLIISVWLGVRNYLTPYVVLEVGYSISMGILLFLLLVGTICILADVPLHLHQQDAPTFFTIQQKRSVLLYFLPLYNVYLRYHLHTFDQPNRWVKESLLRWTFFVVLCVSYHPILLGVLLMIIILRIATLMVGIDVLPLHVKQQINLIFTKNPEELRWYITGICRYGLQAIGHIFHPASIQTSLQSYVDEEKEKYSRLYPLSQYPSLWAEYILGCLLIGWLIWWINPDKTLFTYYLPLVLLGGRYLIMVIFRQHLPRLPLAREIILFFRWPFSFLFSRHTHV